MDEDMKEKNKENPSEEEKEFAGASDGNAVREGKIFIPESEIAAPDDGADTDEYDIPPFDDEYDESDDDAPATEDRPAAADGEAGRLPEMPGGGEGEEKPESFGHWAVGTFYDIVEMIGVITAVIILCFSFVVRLNVVDGPSMENTLHTGEYLVVSDLFYTPARGDIVVLQNLEGADRYQKPLVKRIIATEGQTVFIYNKTGKVTVDGVEIEEEYKNLEGDAINYFGAHMTKSELGASVTVTEGHVFVMGDNRNNSADSRLDGIGLVDVRCIVGKVYARVFPFDKMAIFKNPFS